MDLPSPRMTGHHVTADLASCLADHPALTSAMALRALCLDAVRAAGLTAVGELFHVFPPPGGVTGVVLLAESHLAAHTWPERGVVTLDVYVCNVSVDNSAAALAVVDALIGAFAPRQVQRLHWVRGDPGAEVGGAEDANANASANTDANADTVVNADHIAGGDVPAPSGAALANGDIASAQRLTVAARPAVTPSVYASSNTE